MAVTCNHHVVGILYAKERLFLGCPTGIVYTDTTLGTNLVVEAAHRLEVLRVAMRSFLASGTVRGLRVVVPVDGFDGKVLPASAAAVDIDIAVPQLDNHSQLSLPSSYDDFLHSVGARTRRNLRYYRRRFEKTGGKFVAQVPLKSFCSAAWHLQGRSSIRGDTHEIRRKLNMLAAINEPLLVGLQSGEGEWLSVAGGWCDKGRATLLFQMNNDREHLQDSVSQVLRSYLIEELVARKIHDLVFWAGTSAPLVRYAQHIPTLALYLDSRTGVWPLFRRVLSSLTPGLPRRLAKATSWIIPAARTQDHGRLDSFLKRDDLTLVNNEVQEVPPRRFGAHAG